MTKLPFTFRCTHLPAPHVAIEEPRAKLVAHYIIHSYLYYELGKPLISDFEFDELACLLREYLWDEGVRGQEHFNLLDLEQLETSTSGFYLHYPAKVRGCAEWLLNQQKKGKKK